MLDWRCREKLLRGGSSADFYGLSKELDDQDWQSGCGPPFLLGVDDLLVLVEELQLALLLG